MGQQAKSDNVSPSSRGHPAASAQRLACEGYHVIAVALRREPLDRLVTEIAKTGGVAAALETDITVIDQGRAKTEVHRG